MLAMWAPTGKTWPLPIASGLSHLPWNRTNQRKEEVGRVFRVLPFMWLNVSREFSAVCLANYFLGVSSFCAHLLNSIEAASLKFQGSFVPKASPLLCNRIQMRESCNAYLGSLMERTMQDFLFSQGGASVRIIPCRLLRDFPHQSDISSRLWLT